MYTSVIALFCSVSVTHSYSLPFSPKNKVTTNTQIRNTISQVAQKYFVDESSLGLFLLDNDINYIEMHLPVVIRSEEDITPCNAMSIDLDGYVFVIPKSSFIASKIVTALQCYNKTTLKLSTKKVLIICMQKDNCHNNEHYLQHFYMLWTNFSIINVIVLIGYSTDFHFHPTIIAYNPFQKNDSYKLGVINTFDLSENFECELDKRLFNMHGHVLKAVMFPYNISVHPSFLDKPGSIKGGLDLSLRWALESKFNVCFSIHPPRDGKFHGISINGTFNGALLDVINNHVDIALNAKILKWHDTPRIQFLMPRLSTALIILVKKKDRIGGWEVILHVFQLQVWLWFVSATSITCLVSWLLAKMCLLVSIPSDKYRNQPLDPVWVILKSTISMSVVRLPTLNYARILMASSLWLSVVIVNLFFGQLFYLIKTKPRTANLETLQELLDSNLPIFTSTESFLSAFDGFKDTSLSRLKDRLHLKRFTTVLDGRGYPTKITADYALLYSTTVFQYQQVAEPSEFTETVHFLKELVFQCYLGVFMPIGSVYYNQFYKFTMRIFELGFTNKWMQEYLAFIRENYYQQNPTELNLSVDSGFLTLADLRLAFFVMFFGLILSIVCFVVEKTLII